MDKLFSYALNEWLNDIKKNQLPGLLGGVGPIHSLVQLGKCVLTSLIHEPPAEAEVQSLSPFYVGFPCFQ